MTPADRASSLVEKIAGHKAAIRHHRNALGQAKEDLLRLQRECADAGIKVVVQGGGEHPWPGTFSNSQH